MAFSIPAKLPRHLPASVLLAATVFASPAASHATTPAPDTSSVSPWVSRAERIGPADADRPVRLAVFLPLRDRDGLARLVAAQSNRNSPDYQRFLTPEAFRARFAPPAADVSRVRDALAALGFTVDYVPTSGLVIEAGGTAGKVRRAFGVSQDLYRLNGRVLRANDRNPLLPASLAGLVTFVGGLDDSAALLRPMHRRAMQVAENRPAPLALPPVASGTPPNFCSTYYGDHTATLTTPPSPYAATLPWMVCGYTPAQIRAAYGADKVAYTGAGVKIGVVDIYASPTIEQDANAYAARYDLPALTYANFQQIVPPGLRKVPADDPCDPAEWYVEETLDVEAVHSMAPGAAITYAGLACSDPGNTALYTLIDNRTVDIVSNSYGLDGENAPPGLIQAQDQYFMQAAAEGMSVLFSSGDRGDLSAINGIESGSWQATSPYVTAVGGTSLALLTADGTKQEWGWGSYDQTLAGVQVAADGTSVATSGLSAPAFAFAFGGGGGPSLVELAPAYQSLLPASLTSFTHLANGHSVPLESPRRVTPDIAMVADPYTGFVIGETYTISGDPVADAPCAATSATEEYCVLSIGGTSLAAPLFAGVLALADQARLAAGHATLGLVNAALYELPTGKHGAGTPVVDVAAPATPMAVLRGYLGESTSARVVTINSVPAAGGKRVREGADTHLATTKSYDNVTGLGTPDIPVLIPALAQ